MPAGPHGEAPGLVRSQWERGESMARAFTVFFCGEKNGKAGQTG